jgi:hypothetical protein
MITPAVSMVYSTVSRRAIPSERTRAFGSAGFLAGERIET